jgi:hypothetical protein
MAATHRSRWFRLVVAIGAAGGLLLTGPAATAATSRKPKPTTTTTVKDTNAPTAPTNLRVTGTTRTSVSLA